MKITTKDHNRAQAIIENFGDIVFHPSKLGVMKCCRLLKKEDFIQLAEWFNIVKENLENGRSEYDGLISNDEPIAKVNFSRNFTFGIPLQQSDLEIKIISKKGNGEYVNQKDLCDLLSKIDR